MRSYDSDRSVANPSASSALDEFAIEDRDRSLTEGLSGTDVVVCFECEAQPEPTLSVSGSLLEIAQAEVSRGRGLEPLSRIESRRSAGALRLGRRAAHRLALRMQTRAAATQVRMNAERETIKRHLHAAIDLAQHSASRLVLARRMQTDATPDLEHEEFNGFVVAVVLAVSVVGYGALLAVFWQTPTDARVRRVAVPQYAGQARVMTALAAPVTGGGSVVRASVENRRAVAVQVSTNVERRAAFTPNGRTLTALWQRRDTRSLDRAFSTLRGETLALRNCGMRMTDVDRAVARCEGITIDFQRTGGRWSIARVAKR